jgi:hypothetical protein
MRWQINQAGNMMQARWPGADDENIGFGIGGYGHACGRLYAFLKRSKH